MPDALKSLWARYSRGAMRAAAVTLAATFVFSTGLRPAQSQESVSIGGRGLPAVEVNLEVLRDLGALKDLGPPLQRRRLRMPGQGRQDPNIIRLKPPPGVRVQEVVIRTPRTRPERPVSVGAAPERPGRDPLVRLRRPGEAPSPGTSTRNTSRTIPASPARRGFANNPDGGTQPSRTGRSRTPRACGSATTPANCRTDDYAASTGRGPRRLAGPGAIRRASRPATTPANYRTDDYAAGTGRGPRRLAGPGAIRQASRPATNTANR